HLGTVTFANGIITYTPAADFTGFDNFNYTVSDGSLTASGVVTFTVAAIGGGGGGGGGGGNTPPEFTGDSAGTTFTEGGAAVAIATNVLASDVDSINYNGGSFTATITNGGHPGDTLSIATDAFLTVSGSLITFDADGAGFAFDPVN